MIFRTGYEKYVASAGDVGRDSLKALVWLCRGLFREIITYLKNKFNNHKLK